MKGEAKSTNPKLSNERILIITGCLIWFVIAVWGSVTGHRQCISVAENGLLVLIVFVFGGKKQIEKLIKQVKAWIKD